MFCVPATRKLATFPAEIAAYRCSVSIPSAATAACSAGAVDSRAAHSMPRIAMNDGHETSKFQASLPLGYAFIAPNRPRVECRSTRCAP